MDAAEADALRRLGACVRASRLAALLTQEAFAERCELSVHYVSIVERGKQAVGVLTLRRISGALGMKPSTLLKKAGW